MGLTHLYTSCYWNGIENYFFQSAMASFLIIFTKMSSECEGPILISIHTTRLKKKKKIHVRQRVNTSSHVPVSFVALQSYQLVTYTLEGNYCTVAS